MTIYEMGCAWWKRHFTKPEPSPPEKYNPLKVKVGKSTLTVDTLDLREYTFMIDGIIENTLDYGKKKFRFADYQCHSLFESKTKTDILVRVYEDNKTLVLKEWDKVDYNDDFLNLLKENQFNTMVDDEVEASFWRIEDVKDHYVCQTVDNDGEKRENWFWDYWRETKDEGDSVVKEFLFVIWDKNDTGRFLLFRGEEVIPTQIKVS